MFLVLFGTMAKLDIVSFVMLIPLTLVVFSPRKKLMPFIYGIAGLGFGFFTYKAFRYFRLQIITPRFLETTTEEQSILVTENAMILNDGLMSKVNAGLISVFYYLKFHLIPEGYYYYFGFDMIPVNEFLIWQNIVAMAALLFSLIAFIYFFNKRPEISWGIGFLYGGLMYCLNIYTPIAGIVAPRLAFIASVGFCVIVAAIVISLGRAMAKRTDSPKWNVQNSTILFMMAVILFYLPFTIKRNKAWKDNVTLVKTDIEHLDRSFEGQRIACMTYLDASKWVNDDATAVEYLQNTIRHCETASSIYKNDQFVEETIGLGYYMLRNYSEAYDQFNIVVERFDTSEMALEYLGDMMRMNGSYVDAAAYYKSLVRIAPDYFLGYFKYTQIMQESNSFDEGIEQLKTYTVQYPEYHFPYEGLGFLYLNKKDTVTATHCFFYAMDKGSPNQQYISSMENYYKRKNMPDEWNSLLSGERMDLQAE